VTCGGIRKRKAARIGRAHNESGGVFIAPGNTEDKTAYVNPQYIHSEEKQRESEEMKNE
jgi:hypothetical protein